MYIGNDVEYYHLMKRLENITVVDLFCGIGGLSYGLYKEGFNIAAGIDTDESCRYCYEHNNKAKFICKDVNKVTGKEINQLFGDGIKILVGCAPCQPFSSYSFKHKEKDQNKYDLLYQFSRLVRETHPDIISMENVPQILHFEQKPVFQDFYDTLNELGYKIDFKEIYCPDYGIPQTRKRLVLLASRLGEIKIKDKTHSPKKYRTVKNVIGKLPPVAAGQSDPKDALHRARALSEVNLRRIKATKEGGSWKDWPEELLLECHKKESGATYSSVYGRMKWDEPAPTMTTHCTGLGNGRFGHPEQDRAITLREAASFQTFPKKFRFFKSKKDFNPSVVSRQIGNAVPPRLGAIIGQSIIKHLTEHKKI